jgi:two-component system response regulator DevR
VTTRILLVDDHEVVRAGLRTMLEGEPDFEVVGDVGSADDIERVVTRTEPDVVILDARLPGLSGADACQLLGKSHPDVAVVILSTFSDDALVDECIDAGARGYVIKDIERFDLRQSVRRVARGETVVAPQVAARLFDRRRAGGAGAKSGEAPLTPGQLEILRLVSDGLSNREIAEHVHLSENTIKSHIQEVFRRLGARNRVEAALRASREGWL